ncbi:MAG: hypothetical protein ABW217_23230 [Polyangiaceae bacterium]
MLKSRVHGPRSVSLAALVRAARAQAPLLSLLGATAVGATTLVACAAATDDDGELPPAYGVLPNTPGAAGSGAAPVGGGFGGSSGVTPGVSSGQGGSAYVPPPATGQGGSNGAPPVTGAGGTGTVDNGAGGTAPVNNGTGGTDAVTPPPTGAGGTGTDPNQPPPGDPPPPPVGGDIACPAGATFCSGFEAAALPSGTQFHAVGGAPTVTFELDDAEAFAGNQSLLIPASGAGFYYRALAVPVPGNDFWVRLHVRVSTVFGDGNHDSLFGGSSGGLAADVNGEALVEFSEQFDGILLNTDDAVFRPPQLTTVSANTWHCFEAHYQGGNGNVDVFMDGTQIVAAAAYKAQTYQSFRIGYMRYNTDRAVWFDDVVVAPQRINCP